MGVSERIASRFEKIKKMKSNLILVIVGITLILLAPLWHLVVAPLIKIVPTDFNLFRQYEGTMTEYANRPEEPVIGQTPLDTPVILEQFTLSRPEKSTPGTSVVEVETAILDEASHDRLYESRKTFGMKRRTGELTDFDKSGSKEEGYLIVFPFDTPTGSVPVWLDMAGKIFDAAFVKKTRVAELPVYEFRLEAEGVPVSAPPGFPGEYTGAQLKSAFAKPDLGVGDEAACKARYRANVSYTFLVEPRMGNIAKLTAGKVDLLLSVEEPEPGFKATMLLSKISFSETRDSISRSVSFASEEAAKRKLQFAYIPVFLLALGVVVLVIGLFADVKMKKDGKGD